MKAFVTGGTGFIGSYLIKWLINEGHKVLALKRPSSDLSNLDEYSHKATWVDTTSQWQEELNRYSPDIVYHLAWSGVSSEGRTQWKNQVENLVFQQTLLDAAYASGCKKFVGIGSQSEYGDFQQIVDENFPINPKTAYAAAKVAAYNLLKYFCELHSMEWFWFRLFPLFGPHESDRWLIPSLIKNMMTSNSMDLTEGLQKLPYLYVGECAKAIGNAIYTSNKSGIYNISAENPMTLRSMVESIRDMVNPSFILNFGAIPYRYGQSMLMGGDTSALAKNIYMIDNDGFDIHMKETINYYIAKYSCNDYKRN